MDRRTKIKTPEHIARLIYDLLDIKKSDVVLEPCTGYGIFLHMCNVKKRVGIEIDTAICNNYVESTVDIINADFLKIPSKKIRQKFHPTIGMINPPYGLGTSSDPSLYEINFVKHLLDSMMRGGRVAAIVPISSMTGKTTDIQAVKRQIMEMHTIEGVITVNPATFYGVDIQTAIAVFTAGTPNSKTHQSKFINFTDDGYEVKRQHGLVKASNAEEKKQKLLDVWRGKSTTDSSFCISKSISAEDEWIHSSLYCQEKIPPKQKFEKKVKEYLAFRCVSILKRNQFLFEGQDSFCHLCKVDVEPLDHKSWKAFIVEDIFTVEGTKVTNPKNLVSGGRVPRVCCSSQNNAVEGIYQNAATELGGVLTVESASVGSVFYQQVPFSCSSHVEKLTLKDRYMNVFLGLFLATSFSTSVEDRYSYGYKPNKTRMKKQKIMLPVDKKNKPDYQYMESYMKNMIWKEWKNLKDRF